MNILFIWFALDFETLFFDVRVPPDMPYNLTS